MVVLGIGFVDHEASAALVVDGRVAGAIARERLTRVKSDGKMWGTKRMDPTLPVAYCLDQHGLRLSDVDLVVWNHVDHLSEHEVLEQLAREGSIDVSAIARLSLPHHFAHACCAFYLSPFESAAVLVADGSGGPLDTLRINCGGPEPEALRTGQIVVQNLRRDNAENAREHESFYLFDGCRSRVLRKIVGDYGGIGAEYGSASEVLFGDCLHAGKTMGLAPYGTPHDCPLFLEKMGPDEIPVFRSMHPPLRDDLEQAIVERLRDPYVTYESTLLANFAASIQKETEAALLVHARWLRQAAGSPNLCLSGGVALNCVANSLLAREAGFEAVFVPPAPGDDGIALGCALFGAASKGELRREPCRISLGRSYSHDPDEICAAGFAHAGIRGESVHAFVARQLAAGAIVAWYQGGAELGPRALGFRSFLADPRRADIKHHLNNVVKRRESFRPFAPIVAREAVLEYFTHHYPSSFMSFVADVRPDKRSLLPGVSHVDGSARYQVLDERDNPTLYTLLKAFREVAGVPLLLNTSFNRNKEPLVETPLDAAHCAFAASAEYLVIDGHVYHHAGFKR